MQKLYVISEISPCPHTKVHCKDKSQSWAGPWCIDAPLCLAVPLHLRWGIHRDKNESLQYCLPPPKERETGIKKKSALSVVETDGLPAAVPFIRRVKELPQVVPSVLQCHHLSEAAFLSHHLPPFTSQHSKNRQSQALPWRPASL